MSGQSIFAPFVSGLKAEVNHNRILLSWEPAPVETDSQFVYRFDEPIDSSSFSQAARIAELDGSDRVFTDTPEDQREYYYAVLISNENGRPYEYFIPHRNVLVEPVSVVSTEVLNNFITLNAIEATAEDDSILLKFEASSSRGSLIIYRGTQSIRDRSDLLRATAVASVSAEMKEYRDYPIPGVDYYYAIFDTKAAKSGNYRFVEGENVLSKPIRLPLHSGTHRWEADSAGGEVRIVPIPTLLLSRGVRSGRSLSTDFTTLPEREPLNEKTLDVWKSLKDTKLSLTYPTRKMDFDLLEEERAKPNNSSAGRLSGIVSPLLKGEEIDSDLLPMLEKQLVDFLDENIDEELAVRAHFYLGQVYYFQNKHREALFEFLWAYDRYYTKVQAWLNALFSVIQL
ncbi:MAG TPA: hypothetical protein ENN41_06455 [Sediminispirochaeta sp.]|nr:hypothetical protein [Sediminispirochaeta sp.]